jgi:hypothetical protein
MMQLVRAMAGIADAVAEFRTVQQRLDQAATAQQAAAHLAAYQPPQQVAVGVPADLPLAVVAGPVAPNRPTARGR